MSNTVIKVEGISKQYRLGTIGTGTFAHDLKRWWYLVRGREDPFARVGDVNDRTKKGSSELVWALRDVSFDVQQGEIVGIIGKNGAGKSTLLKILSRTTLPSTGGIKVKGRIASLLEVGTGFHPELSGRENIFLNGAILGMKKNEIVRKFDEIVDFSGVERYIDTPVKRYSSGMYVRLAFAVAAHLEPEILIVDEVLAVGDMEFQKKCLGKMQDVSGKQGRTVLFVSHSMGAIRQLCSRGLVLQNGAVRFSGDIERAIDCYLSTGAPATELTSNYIKPKIENNPIELLQAELLSSDLSARSEFDAAEDILIRLKLCKNINVPNIQGYLLVRAVSDEAYIESDTFDVLPNVLDELPIGEHELLLRIRQRTLPAGQFKVYLNFTSTYADAHNLDSPRDVLKFNVYDHGTRRGHNRKAYTSTVVRWEPISYRSKA